VILRSIRGDLRIEFTRANGEAIWFASADLTKLLAGAPAGSVVLMNQQVLPWEAIPLWTVVSITNNTTQAVELVPDYCH
jgi:hypothetical protein